MDMLTWNRGNLWCLNPRQRIMSNWGMLKVGGIGTSPEKSPSQLVIYIYICLRTHTHTYTHVSEKVLFMYLKNLYVTTKERGPRFNIEQGWYVGGGGGRKEKGE